MVRSDRQRPALRRAAYGTAALAAAVALAGCGRQAASPEEAVAVHWDILDRYCTECHDDAEAAGNLSLARVTPASVAENPELWEKVVRKLRGDLMPPPPGPRPDPEVNDEFVAALERYLDETAKLHGARPGNVPLHRLNRTEYAASIQELLGIEIDARAMLPGDLASEGFDNVADVLGVSPTHLDQYIAAARDISIMAVGDPAPDTARALYRTELANRTRHLEGLPLGTRDGIVAVHDFPADGTYEVNIAVSSIPGSELRGYPYGWLDYEHELVVTLDGVPVFSEKIGGPEDQLILDQQQIQGVDAIRERFQGIRLEVKAGRREIAAAFVARSFAEGDYLLQSLVPGEGVPDIPRLYGLEVLGPYDPSGISEPTESRKRIFTCYPSSEIEERPCAEQILTNLARRAFRRPVSEADLVPILGFYDSGREQGGFETGIQKGLMAILASTKFLYRTAPTTAAEPSGPYPITDLELAWRLSYFLWSRGPDEPLLTLAERGELSNPEVLQREVERMLADPRSKSLITNFAFQWLGVRRLEAIDPDPRLYPNFDEDLRAAFREEMELFLDSVLRADRPVLDLLDARDTFLNERLARHYGVANVRGDQFRRVELDDPRRFGLFGKGSVLMVTSYPDRTSPVLRGAWIMEHVIATPPAPVPPNVETDLTQPPGDIPRSVRERLARHRTEPSCNHCHGVIDPLGQALENFNAIGEWRTEERENGVPIDSSGQLAGGGEVNGPEDLRNALLAEPDLFVQALIEKLMVFALGRGLEYYDMPTVREIRAQAEREGYRFASIVRGIVQSEAFRMRGPAEEPAREL